MNIFWIKFFFTECKSSIVSFFGMFFKNQQANQQVATVGLFFSIFFVLIFQNKSLQRPYYEFGHRVVCHFYTSIKSQILFTSLFLFKFASQLLLGKAQNERYHNTKNF